MIRMPLSDERASVKALSRDLGLGAVEPRVIKAAHHTTFVLSPLPLVARVQTSEPVDVAWRLAEREIAVTRFLAASGAPAITPLTTRAGPHLAGMAVTTLWPLLQDARPAVESEAALVATALCAVHRTMANFDGALPHFTTALDACLSLLANDQACAALSSADRALLTAAFRRLRAEIDTMPLTWQPLHGDAHLGNCLIHDDRPVWIDFEDACLGPREYDVACLPPEAWSRFADLDHALIQRFADLRSVCVAIWCWADLTRSADAGEAAVYHLQRVRGFGC